MPQIQSNEKHHQSDYRAFVRRYKNSLEKQLYAILQRWPWRKLHTSNTRTASRMKNSIAFNLTLLHWIDILAFIFQCLTWYHCACCKLILVYFQSLHATIAAPNSRFTEVTMHFGSHSMPALLQFVDTEVSIQLFRSVPGSPVTNLRFWTMQITLFTFRVHHHR